jgi:hypothetical protein
MWALTNQPVTTYLLVSVLHVLQRPRSVALCLVHVCTLTTCVLTGDLLNREGWWRTRSMVGHGLGPRIIMGMAWSRIDCNLVVASLGDARLVAVGDLTLTNPQAGVPGSPQSQYVATL